MRHGRTAGNTAKQYIGSTDEPLCQEGILHARNSGISTGTARVFVSPMTRALDTARIKFPGARLTICPDLREMDFGDFEGRSAADMAQDAAYREWVESSCTLPCPNGEGLNDFSDRVCRAFDKIVGERIENNDDQLVIVAHGGTIMAILGKYGKPERQYYEWSVDNCCGYRARMDAEFWVRSPALTDCVMFETLV